jgi:hypothetical protein
VSDFIYILTGIRIFQPTTTRWRNVNTVPRHGKEGKSLLQKNNHARKRAASRPPNDNRQDAQRAFSAARQESTGMTIRQAMAHQRLAAGGATPSRAMRVIIRPETRAARRHRRHQGS